MKILYLSHRIPYPPNKGDKIRSFNEIKHLSKLHEIDLACLADNINDMQYQQDLNQYCRRVFVSPLNTTWANLKGLTYLAFGKAISVGYFYLRKVQQTVDQWLKQTDYDAIICFSSPMGEYIFRSRCLWSGKVQGIGHKVQGKKKRIFADLGPYSLHPRPVLIMDFCDVDSEKWAQYAEVNSFPKSLVYRLENRRLAYYERRVAEQFDLSVFVSRKEAEIFLNKNPHLTNISVIPNGVDYEYFAPAQKFKVQGSRFKEIRDQESVIKNQESRIRERHEEEDTVEPHLTSVESAPMPPTPNLQSPTDSMPYAPCPILLFTGAMDYYANVDGVKWFCDNIYPEIKRKVPNTEFRIVGSNPNANVRALQKNNAVKVTGFVEDIRPYYHMADVCVIPLRLARGIQNKVLEAMCMEKAVITTSQAIQGITAVNGEHLVVADEPEDFSKAVVKLLNHEERRRILGENARRFIKSNYDWQRNMRKLEKLLITRISADRNQ